MSAKVKQRVPGGGVETLVTVERLAGIQKAMGQTQCHPASLPGAQYTGGAKSLKCKLEPGRAPFIWIRFTVQVTRSPSNVTIRHVSVADSTRKTEKKVNFTVGGIGTLYHYAVIITNVYGLGTAQYPKTYVGVSDPIAVELDFVFDTNNGGDYNSWVKNVVIGSCPTAEVPFLVKQGDTVKETLIEIGLP